MHVRAVADRLCRRRCLCISSFTDASQIPIPIHGILHVRLKFTHTALSKPPINGILRDLWQQKSHAALSRINLARVGNSVALFILAVVHRSTFSLLFPDPKGHPPPGRLEMSLQAQLGRLHTTRRHQVTSLHWCVHSMAPNLNSEHSQPPSSFTVALQHGSSKLPRLVLQHCLRASK